MPDRETFRGPDIVIWLPSLRGVHGVQPFSGTRTRLTCIHGGNPTESYARGWSMSSYVTHHSIHTQVSCGLLKISWLVAIAATVPIISNVGELLDIRPRVGVPQWTGPNEYGKFLLLEV